MDAPKNNVTSFSMSRGWALNWAPLTEPIPHTSIALAVAPPSLCSRAQPNGTERAFPEPRGWACNWEGGALDMSAISANGHKPAGHVEG